MRLIRNQGKYAAKRQHSKRRPRYGQDGPGCPHCEPHNGRLRRETLRAREHAREILEGWLR